MKKALWCVFILPIMFAFWSCSDPVSPSATVSAPTAPQSFTASPSDKQVKLSWTAPTSNGGAVITKYEVSSDSGATWTEAESDTDHTFTGLTNDTEYTFKVRAVNSAGNGAQVTATATPSATITAPTAPQNFTATAGDKQVKLSWSVPSSNGGATITKYEVSRDNGTSWTEAASDTAHTFTGLTNGTEYTFKIRAVNSAGNGAQATATATPDTTDNGIANGIAVVTMASDYSASNFEIINTDNYTVKDSLINSVLHTDLAVRTSGRDVYILERLGKDNIIKYDTKEMAVAYQENLGAGINIQDIAVVSGTKAYISCNNNKYLIVFNPQSGTKTSQIDLSGFSAGTASHPYASAMAVYGSYVYVACQRFTDDFYGPQDFGKIVVINSQTNLIEDSIILEKKNPMAMDISGNRLLVASAGETDPLTWAYVGGGIEMIDLMSNENLGVVTDIDGASNIVFVSADKAYVCASMPDWSTKVFPVNPTARTKGASLSYIQDGFGGIAYDGTKVYVGDRDLGNAGVVVINPSTDAFERRIATGMPPAGLGAFSKN